MVYDSVVVESRLGGVKAESVGKSKEFDVEHVGNEFVVEDAKDSDEDELILRFKRTVPTKPQTMTKPTLKCQRKTTTSPNVPLDALLSRLRTRSLGPPIVLPLPEDRVKSPVMKKKPTLKSTKTSTKTPAETPTKTPIKSVPSKKLAKKWAAPE